MQDIDARRFPIPRRLSSIGPHIITGQRSARTATPIRIQFMIVDLSYASTMTTPFMFGWWNVH